MTPSSMQPAATGRLVVKLGGRVQQDRRLPAALAALAAERPGALYLVHGGGDEISALQRTLGVEPAFVDGRRVTSESDVDLVRMALSGTSNKRLVSSLIAHGVRAVGISGEDASLIVAAVTEPALGRVGQVRAVDPSLLETLSGHGFLPVISPVGRDADGHAAALNVNGDDAAAAIAAAIGAAEILFLADVPGVLRDGAPLAALDGSEARALVAQGVAVGGMAAKLDAALAALAAGVPSARIGDIGSLADPDAGTRITLAPALA